MSKQDQIKWNLRYRAQAQHAMSPVSFLQSIAELLPPGGRVLDVAGGSGRNAVWLAQRQFDVTVLDISEVGLALAAKRASDAGVEVRTLACDIEEDGIPGGPWDVILDTYFLLRPLFGAFAQALAPCGYFVFVHPTRSNLQRHQKPSSQYLLGDGELPQLISGMRVLIYREGWNPEGRYTAELLAQPSEIHHIEP